MVLTALPSFVSLDSNAKGGKREEKTIDELVAPGLCLLLIRAEGFLGHSQIRKFWSCLLFAQSSKSSTQIGIWLQAIGTSFRLCPTSTISTAMASFN